MKQQDWWGRPRWWCLGKRLAVKQHNLLLDLFYHLVDNTVHVAISSARDVECLRTFALRALYRGSVRAILGLRACRAFLETRQRPRQRYLR